MAANYDANNDIIYSYNNITLWENQRKDVDQLLEMEKNNIMNFDLTSSPGSGKTNSILFFLLNKSAPALISSLTISRHL